MYNALLTDKGTPELAFTSLMEFIASKFEFKETINTPWLKPETLQYLQETFSLELLQEDPWDWFGELHNELGLSLIDNSLLLSRTHLEKVAPDTTTTNILASRILDTETYTGRHIIEMWRKNPKAVYYGVESDTLAYQIALLNMNCYGIRHSILQGNPNEMDLRPYSSNWRETNVWTPGHRRIKEDETDERLRIVDGFYRVV